MRVNEEQKFLGRCVVITGAGNGIGSAVARRFIAQGARVIGVDVDRDALARLADELGARFVPIVADVACDDVANDYIAEALQRLGRIDVLLLNAGVLGVRALMHEMPIEEFDRVIGINLRGVWIGLSRAMGAMRATGGVVTIMSSTGGYRGTAGFAPYSTSKHAIVGMMKAAALEGAGHGIRVNCIHPGPIATDLFTSAGHAGLAGASAPIPTPIGRVGTPNEVANLVDFLSSEAASYCTGASYLVDGGVLAGAISDLD